MNTFDFKPLVTETTLLCYIVVHFYEWWCLSAEKERSDSPPTRDTPSLTRVSRVPTDDIEKLQLEMELCLQQIESVQKRALSGECLEWVHSVQKWALSGECLEWVHPVQKWALCGELCLEWVHLVQKRVLSGECQVSSLTQLACLHGDVLFVFFLVYVFEL